MGIGKKFINSVTSQVGRDTGKVISNSLYGEAHSTPIRVVQNHYYETNNNEVSLEEAKDTLSKSGYLPKVKLQNIAIVFILFIVAIPALYISPIAFIWRGVINLNKKETPYAKPITQANYVQDRRYRTGSRISGYSVVESIIKMPATSLERKKYKSRGILYIVLGAILLMIQSRILYSK